MFTDFGLDEFFSEPLLTFATTNPRSRTRVLLAECCVESRDESYDEMFFILP